MVDVSMERLPRPERMEDAVLVTHRGCLDGSGCALLFPGNVKVFVVAGQVERFVKEDPLWESDKFLVFADVGLNTPRYADMFEKRGNVVLLDHHKTSLHLSGRDWCMIDMDACGTELLRRYLGYDDDASRHMAACIDDHDRWILNDPDSSRLANLMSFLEQERFVFDFWNYRERFGQGPVFNEFERNLLEILTEKRDRNIEHLLGRINRREVTTPDGKTWSIGYVISSEPNSSLLLDRMLELNPDVQVACQLNFDRRSVSLRSRDPVDVSEFSRHFGGGGHARASGHPFPAGFMNSLVEELHS